MRLVAERNENGDKQAENGKRIAEFACHPVLDKIAYGDEHEEGSGDHYKYYDESTRQI